MFKGEILYLEEALAMTGASNINALNLSPPTAGLPLSSLPLSSIRSSMSTTTTASDWSMRGSESDETDCSGWQLASPPCVGSDAAFLGLPTELLESPGASPRYHGGTTEAPCIWWGADTGGGTMDETYNYDGSGTLQYHQHMPALPSLAPVVAQPPPLHASPPAIGAIRYSGSGSEFDFDAGSSHTCLNTFSESAVGPPSLSSSLPRERLVRSCPGRWGSRKIQPQFKNIEAGAKGIAERWADVCEEHEEMQAPLPPGYLQREEAALPSRGSAGHVANKCKPCVFLHTERGCTNGFACTFCHLCPPGEKKKRQSEKLDRKNRQRHEWLANQAV